MSFGSSKHFNIRPDKFDGTTDWEEYQLHFQTCAQLGKWDGVTKTTMFAVSRLGAARRFYSCLSVEDRQSYDKLQAHFNVRFRSHKQQDQFKAKLSMYKRKVGESKLTDESNHTSVQ